MIVFFWLWYVVRRNTVRFGSTIHTLLRVAQDKGTLGILSVFCAVPKQLMGRVLNCLEVWALGFERQGSEFGGLVGF